MKPKTKKPRKQRKPKTTKSTKSTKDKSVKQNVNVNVTSSGGGGSGGSSIPSSQPYQNPMISQFRQSEKVGENIDIKNLTDILKNLGVGLTEKTAKTKPLIMPIFENQEIPSEIQIKRNPITNNNSLIDNLNEANQPRIINDSEVINYPDDLEEAEEANNPNIISYDEMRENIGMGQEDILSKFNNSRYGNIYTQQQTQELLKQQEKEIENERKKKQAEATKKSKTKKKEEERRIAYKRAENDPFLQEINRRLEEGNNTSSENEFIDLSKLPQNINFV